MLKSVLERLDAGQLINSEANYATQLKSLLRQILWLFFCLQQLWQSPSAKRENHIGGKIMWKHCMVTIGRIDWMSLLFMCSKLAFFAPWHTSNTPAGCLVRGCKRMPLKILFPHLISYRCFQGTKSCCFTATGGKCSFPREALSASAVRFGQLAHWSPRVFSPRFLSLQLEAPRG